MGKRESSYREIPIGKDLVRTLSVHRKRQAEHRLSIGKYWKDNNFAFPNKSGEPMEPSLPNRNLKRTLKAVGIYRNVRIHDLRHTCGSLMAEKGVPVERIRDILGHKNIQTTYDLYIHTSTETLRDAIDVLDEAIF